MSASRRTSSPTSTRNVARRTSAATGARDNPSANVGKGSATGSRTSARPTAQATTSNDAPRSAKKSENLRGTGNRSGSVPTSTKMSADAPKSTKTLADILETREKSGDAPAGKVVDTSLSAEGEKKESDSSGEFREAWLQMCFQESQRSSRWVRIRQRLARHATVQYRRELACDAAMRGCLHETLIWRCLDDHFPGHFDESPRKLTTSQKRQMALDAAAWLSDEVCAGVSTYAADSDAASSTEGDTIAFLECAFATVSPSLEKRLFDLEKQLKQDKSAKRVLPSGPHSDVIAAALMDIVRYSPTKSDALLKRLDGRPLPAMLRKHLWESELRKMIACAEAEDEDARRSIVTMRAPATTAVSSSTIQSLVAKLNSLDVDESLKEAIRRQGVNVAALFEALQLEVNEDHMCLLAPLVDGLNLRESNDSTAQQQQQQIAAQLYVIARKTLGEGVAMGVARGVARGVAEAVVEEVSLKDMELFSAVSRHAPTDGSADYRQLIEGWIRQGFVGVLRWPAVMYVWDQLFAGAWHEQRMRSICIAILLLLKGRLLGCRNWIAVRRVLMSDAGALYVSDLHLACTQVNSGGELQQIHVQLTAADDIWFDDTSSASGFADGDDADDDDIDAVLATVSDALPLPPHEGAAPKLGKLWEKQRPAMLKNLPEATSSGDAFDLYVDQIRFLPDNASITKVVGKVLNAGIEGNLPGIIAFPCLESAARSPSFAEKQAFNLNCERWNAGAVVLLRVYTVDVDTRKLAIIGSCLLGPFMADKDGQNKLRVGGHQLQLRQGLPKSAGGLANLRSTDMDSNIVVPATTLLVRLLPHTRKQVAAHPYRRGYYSSEHCYPSISEDQLYEHYLQNSDYPYTAGEAFRCLLATDGIESPADEARLREGYRKRLQTSSAVSRPGQLTLQRCVTYDKQQGVCVRIKSASGLPPKCEGMYTLAFGRIMPGSEAARAAKDISLKEVIYTQHVDYSSRCRGPVWTGTPMVLHPFRDGHTCLLVSLYGLQGKFTPANNVTGQRASIATIDGHAFTTGCEAYLGWAVVPLFRGKYVLSGKHQVPLFKSTPSPEFLDKLAIKEAPHALKGAIRPRGGDKPLIKMMEGASLTVWICDGHFEMDDVPNMPTRRTLLQATGADEKYLAAAAETGSGDSLTQHVARELPRTILTHGPDSAAYRQSMQDHEQVMATTLTTLVFKKMF